MKTLKFTIAILCLLAGFSCESEKTDRRSVPEEMTFSVSAEAVVDGPAVSWQTDDAISVFDGKANNEFAAVEAGQTAAFVGTANSKAEAFMALYPYVAGIGRYSGKVYVELPASQDAVAGGYDATACLAAAYVQNDNSKSLQFKNLCAFLKIKLQAADDVVSVQVESNQAEPLSGNVAIGLFKEPTIEPAAANAVASVALTGTALNGEYYIAVLPQVLEGGYKLTLTSSDELKYTVNVTSEVAFERNEVYDLGSYSKIEWVATVNPNPTKVPSLNFIRASFEPGEFNVVSEPGFETYPDQAIGYRSSWRAHASVTTLTAHSGSVAVKSENPTPGVWWDLLLQSVALKPNTDYEYSLWAQAGTPHDYTGVRCYPLNAGQEIAGPTWAPASSWTNISRTFNSGSNYYGDVFCGLWGDAGAFFGVDDIKLIPKGYDKKSMEPTSFSVVGDMTNTSFDAISKLGKVVAWKAPNGKLRMALSNLTVNGKHYDTAIAYCDATNLTEAVNLTRFVKKGGVLAPVLVAGEGELSIVPNAAFTVGEKTYLHYYVKTVDTDDNTWQAARSGFLVSEDDGKTWKKTGSSWSGTGCFVEAAFCQKDGVLYMTGSKAGRAESFWSNMYVAKISMDKDFTDAAQWDYWNGTEWFTGDEIACQAASCCITVGNSGEPALVYNPKFERFMMIYRSGTHKGLVYRDADAIDGFWSGEKIITDDDTAGLSYAPSVLDVTADGDLLMVVPQL